VLCSDADTEDSGNECVGQEPLANDNHCEAVCCVVEKEINSISHSLIMPAYQRKSLPCHLGLLPTNG